MNIEPIYNIPQKRLANLPNVITRLIKRDMPWLDETLSPRRLLFGLYVYYQNTRKQINALNRRIINQNVEINNLLTRIADLEGYEKQVIYAKYYAVITYFHWSCGDGCCSDSWHGYRVFGEMNEVIYECGMSGSNSYMSEHRCQEEIKEKYGNIKVTHEDDWMNEEND